LLRLTGKRGNKRGRSPLTHSASDLPNVSLNEDGQTAGRAADRGEESRNGRDQVLGTVTPASSASRTSSATDPARIFSITRPRWTLTVFSTMPRAAAMCLFCMPGKDLGSARAQQADAPLALSAVDLGGPIVCIPRHSPLNRGDEILGVHRLGEQVERPRLHGLDARLDVGGAGGKNDGHAAARGRQHLLQLDPGEAGHSHV
jgi:hypothetical protein